ncbi:MAG: 6-bladed beta-propeller [Gemmatimonadetes bacterium]|nr:6-bladed beta-propeller [Gemmatimonadota bacterium]
MSRWVVVAVVGLVGAGACTQSGGDLAWSGEMIDSAGVTVVSNPAEGIWGGESPWSLEEEMRVGSLDGSPETQFGQIGARGIDRLSDGRIVVLDAMGQHLKVFAPDGTYQATLGGPGSGPGELGAGNQFVIVGRGDTIYVPDLQNQRVSLYSGEGSSLGSFPMDFSNGIPFLWDATGSGDVVAQLRPLALPGQAESDGQDRIVAFGPDGSVQDTLFSFASGGSFNFASDRPEIRFFAPEPAWDVTPEGQVLFGMSDQYRISVYEPAGTLTRIISKPFSSPPVEENDQGIIMEFLEEAWGDAGVPPQAIEQLRGVVEFADTYPAFARVQGGPEGTVWVQRIQPLSELSDEALAAFNFLEDVGSPNWEVFDREGRFLGTFTMPLRFAPRLFVGDEILGVSRDELDVQYLVRMRFIMD